MEQRTVMSELVFPRSVEIVRHHIDHIDVTKKLEKNGDRMNEERELEAIISLAKNRNVVALFDQHFAGSDRQTEKKTIFVGLLCFFFEYFVHRLKKSSRTIRFTNLCYFE